MTRIERAFNKITTAYEFIRRFNRTIVLSHQKTIYVIRNRCNQLLDQIANFENEYYNELPMHREMYRRMTRYKFNTHSMMHQYDMDLIGQ